MRGVVNEIQIASHLTGEMSARQRGK